MPSSARRFTFRTTIMSLFLFLLLGTVAAVWTFSNRHALFTAEQLTAQILEQTSARVEQEIRSLLDRAATTGRVNRNLIESAQLDPENLLGLVTYFREVIREIPELEYLSFGFESNGDYAHVYHAPDGSYVVLESVTNDRGSHDRTDYVWKEGGWEETGRVTDYPYDPRKRPFYQAAVEAGRQTWADTYVFLEPDALTPQKPGITCSTPVFTDGGALLGVLTADFHLFRLSDFLERLEVGENGIAFVIERSREGERRVIAHPDHEILIREVVPEEGQPTEVHLVSIDEIADPRIRSFMDEIAAEATAAAPGRLREVAFDAEGVRYVGGYRAIGGESSPRWWIGSLLPEDDVMGPIRRNNIVTTAIALASVAAGVFLVVLVSGRISRPLRELAGETEEIGDFRLDAKPHKRSAIVEVDRLIVGMEEMKASLRSFQKYVPAELVRDLLASGEEAVLGGHRARLTVYFSDIAGFTSMSEKMTPEELVEILGDYLSAMTAEVRDEGGTVDKYIGDALMAFWGAPTPNPDHAFAACSAALRNQRVLGRLRREWLARGRPEIHMRIGINTGDLVVGNMGAETRMDYTVFGDTVNLASRLEGLNKYYGTDILIGEGTHDDVADRIVARPLDRVSVKGKTQGVMVYELLGLRGDAGSEAGAPAAPGDERFAEVPSWARAHAEGLEHYFQRRWDEAEERFRRVQAERPGDLASRRLLDRIAGLRESPPPEGWNGTFQMESK